MFSFTVGPGVPVKWGTAFNADDYVILSQLYMLIALAGLVFSVFRAYQMWREKGAEDGTNS